ncbi:hypothetical protein [Sphingomonas sp. HMP9]|nr:hypothetical protein [Sphingomonas sp. HMP9]
MAIMFLNDFASSRLAGRFFLDHAMERKKDPAPNKLGWKGEVS